MTTPRPRALVVYESFFGNTQRVAQAVGRGLETRFEVEVLEVSQAPTDRIDLDLLVVGGPIHGFTMTRPSTRENARDLAHEQGREPVSPDIGVREWLGRLGLRPGGVAAAAFDTAMRLGWFAAGSAARGEARLLREHGFELLLKPEHFWVAGTEGPLREGEESRAEAWGHRLANEWAATGHRPYASPLAEVRA